MSERKVVIESADMSEDMQQYAVDCATQALEKYNNGEDIADISSSGTDVLFGKMFYIVHPLFYTKFNVLC